MLTVGVNIHCVFVWYEENFKRGSPPNPQVVKDTLSIIHLFFKGSLHLCDIFVNFTPLPLYPFFYRGHFHLAVIEVKFFVID